MDEKQMLQEYKRNGSLALLGRLYEPYMSLLYGVCYKYIQDHDRSQDAVMEIFEQLITKLRIHEVEYFKSWLYSYARNYCLMALRKDKNALVVPLDEGLIEEDFVLPADSISRWEEQHYEGLSHCMAELSTDQHLCVRFFYLEQKCYKDIVLLTGLEMNQVKSYIQNGKRNLKICMERKGYGK